MKNLFLTASVLAVSSMGAMAGGLDRSGQGIGIIFEQGGYVELSYGMVMPSVSGAFGAISSGDMAPTYSQFSLGVKQDINEKISVAIILDQPFGANVDYATSPAVYPFSGTSAALSSQAVTAVARYKLSDRLSVHAGLRHQTMTGVVAIPLVAYTLDVTGSGGLGYVIGGAFEIPDIALRVSLSYNSAIGHTFTGTERGAAVEFDSTTPQSVNLDFQSGIAADTLLFGSIRWVDWTSFDITPPGYAAVPGGSLVDYSNDVFTYTIGVGRKFSDSFSGSLALGYETATGDPGTNLAPTDGFFSVQLGGKYTMGDMNISGGIRYVILGDTTTETIGASFTDNSAIGIGLKVGYSF